MALQSSGAISISDIKTELGSTSNSLDDLSASAGFTAPHKISDFYGYSAATASEYYWNFGENDGGAHFTGNGGNIGADPFSFSLWIKPNWTSTDLNVLLFEINDGGGVNNNRLMLLYDYGFNRLVYRYRSNSANYHINWALNQNSAAGSISRWTKFNRGPVNSNLFAHIAGTLDPSQSSAVNGLKLYWNGVAFDTTITQSNASLGNFLKSHMYINVAFNAGGDRDAEYDNVAFWFNRLLTPSDITTLYNNGEPITAADAGLSNNLGFEATAESGFLDETGQWTQQYANGALASY